MGPSRSLYKSYRKSFDSGDGIMRNNDDYKEKSKIDTDDGWNRSLYGSPTIGGIIVVGAIVLYLIFK